MKTFYDYIIASGKNGTIYNGVTNNLIKRVAQHKRKEIKGFTWKYEVSKLVWYEQTNDISFAIQREKQIKKWNRKWKIRLIEKENPEWNDLYFEIGGTEEMLDLNFPLLERFMIGFPPGARGNDKYLFCFFLTSSHF